MAGLVPADLEVTVIQITTLNNHAEQKHLRMHNRSNKAAVGSPKD